MTTQNHKITFDVDTFGHKNTYKVALQFPKEQQKPQVRKSFVKKYNLSIRKEDLIVLNKIQDTLGESRTALLNKLMSAIMMRFLLSYTEVDARLEIARWADEKSGSSKENESWVNTALQSKISDIKNNYRSNNTAYESQRPIEPGEVVNSSEYFAVTSKLKDN